MDEVSTSLPDKNSMRSDTKAADAPDTIANVAVESPSDQVKRKDTAKRPTAAPAKPCMNTATKTGIKSLSRYPYPSVFHCKSCCGIDAGSATIPAIQSLAIAQSRGLRLFRGI
mmetsp:Transcript_8934/g.19675  ORF Transcript_8934/g.19675 Transcript_8934/m.19675 type:complete len:113 (-) Transcript_8934:1030-1368(-)